MLLAHSSPVEHGVVLTLGAVAIAVYAWAWYRSVRPRPWRLVAWTAGIVTLQLSVLPAMEDWALRSFTGHMVQHLMMIVITAPLLVVAEPVRTIRALAFVSFRTTRSERSVGRWWRANGAVAAAATFVGVLYLTHLTSIYDDALTNRIVHDVEHVAYLASAVALWAALRSPGRAAAPARIGSIFAVIGGSALLGVVLLSASSPLIPTYEAQLGAAAALDDQRLAASLMWVGGMATTLPLLIVAVWGWASTEERIAQRTEALVD